MWMRGLNFGIPVYFMTLWTIDFGRVMSFLAWAIVLYKYWKDRRKIIPIALYMFTAAVCVALVGYHVAWELPYDIRNKVVLGTSLQSAAKTAYLVVSFTFLILSLVCLRGYRGPGRRILQIGSIVLIVIQCLGFIVIVLTLPRMPLCC
jgi:hypothetical protein